MKSLFFSMLHGHNNNQLLGILIVANATVYIVLNTNVYCRLIFLFRLK